MEPMGNLYLIKPIVDINYLQCRMICKIIAVSALLMITLKSTTINHHKPDKILPDFSY
jgi:hypothetical protein